MSLPGLSPLVYRLWLIRLRVTAWLDNATIAALVPMLLILGSCALGIVLEWWIR